MNEICQEFDLWLEMNPTFNNGDIQTKTPYTIYGKDYMSVFAPIKENSTVVAALQIDLNVSQKLPSLAKYLLVPILAKLTSLPTLLTC